MGPLPLRAMSSAYSASVSAVARSHEYVARTRAESASAPARSSSGGRLQRPPSCALVSAGMSPVGKRRAPGPDEPTTSTWGGMSLATMEQP